MKTKSMLLVGVGVIVLFLLGTISASAQGQGKSAIRGTVKDPQGAAAVGALLSLSGDNVPSQTTTSDSSGGFSFTGLQPGTYKVRAVWPASSESFEEKNVNVRAGKTTTLNIRLRRRE